MIPQEKLNRVLERFEAIQAEMAAGPDAEIYVGLSREYAQLSPVAEAIRNYHETLHERDDLETMIQQGGDDKDMAALATEELRALKEKLPELERQVQLMLLPRDEADEMNAILEVRAGTGGEEAALFAGDLFRMYSRHADSQGWKVTILSSRESDTGGYREIIAGIEGAGVFSKLKFESGVHRVQRVPETESGGRIHTSAATVAVLPEPEEADANIEIPEKDIRTDVYRASGAGGQHVNTTDSAVRVTHLPTGIVVTQQSETSQHKNRAQAMKVLRARIYEQQRDALATERASDRKQQIGSGDRSQRIRTYNFPQGRVTDHRINLTLYKLDQIMAGPGLAELIDALISEDQANRLADISDES